MLNTIKRNNRILFATVIMLLFVMTVISQCVYADADYDRAVNAAPVVENRRMAITLPWDGHNYGGAYLKFTPGSDGYYEFYLYNQYGTPNAEDVWYDVYPSADDAYLRQNDALWDASEYIVSEKAEWKIVKLNKGETYYIRIDSVSSNSSYNTYQFMVKQHTHSWTSQFLYKGSFHNSGDAAWICKCYEQKYEEYPMMDTVRLSRTSYTYTGSEFKPSVTIKSIKGNIVTPSNYSLSYSNNRNVGKANVKITGRGGYEGEKIVHFKINPKGTTISIIARSRKALTTRWKKQTTQTTGYQIQCSTNKKFKSGNKILTIKWSKARVKKISKLKSKKKYYVRIRTYKTVSGIKYYSEWSKAKVAVTK